MYILGKKVTPKGILATLVGLALVAGVFYVSTHYLMSYINAAGVMFGGGMEQFPALDETKLTEGQKKFVQIVRTEYDEQLAGTKYSDGVSEPWCADFVSWVMREQGKPFKNPESGSWRIPGVLTLRSYLMVKNMYHSWGDGYTPKTGDIVIYDGNGPFGQHTNFVLKVEKSYIYTVGGNEVGKIHAQVHRFDASLKAEGFGAVTYE